MSLKVEPPFVDTCHCTAGVGAPPAAAVKPAVVASHTVCDTGCVVRIGGEATSVLAEAESFVALPSHAPLDTVAVLVTVPPVDAVTVTVTVADAPAASVPSWHVTFVLPPQVPWLEIADWSVAPAGSV